MLYFTGEAIEDDDNVCMPISILLVTMYLEARSLTFLIRLVCSINHVRITKSEEIPITWEQEITIQCIVSC